MTAIRLGLTGGIGSGKSTAATTLATMGATIIDADAISRAATAGGGAAVNLIRTHFGPSMLTADGALDRERMRQTVFSDPDAKRHLEAIVHPVVECEITKQTTEAERGGARCIVFDIPLLVESGHWRQGLHRILVIDCTQETQIERVSMRNGLRSTEIQRIIATQATRTQRAAIADMVLFNDGITIDQLQMQLQKIAPQFGL